MSIFPTKSSEQNCSLIKNYNCKIANTVLLSLKSRNIPKDLRAIILCHINLRSRHIVPINLPSFISFNGTNLKAEKTALLNLVERAAGDGVDLKDAKNKFLELIKYDQVNPDTIESEMTIFICKFIEKFNSLPSDPSNLNRFTGIIDKNYIRICKTIERKINNYSPNTQTEHELYLNGFGLKFLPYTFFQCTFLNMININNNNLTSNKYSWGEFKQLKYLHCEDNQLNTLPKGIGHLPQLEFISAGGNPFTSAPDESEKFEALKKLFLSRKVYNILPERFDKFRR